MFKSKALAVLMIIAPLLLLSTALRAEVINIDKQQLVSLLEKGTTMVDVRRLDEWNETGIIRDSHMLTFFDADGDYDAEKWLGSLEQLVSSNEPIILICRSGARTRIISQWLSEKQGYATVYNVTTGILGWQHDGGKTSAP